MYFRILASVVLATVLLSGCKSDDPTSKPGEKAADKPAATDTEPRVALVPFSPGGDKPVVDVSAIGEKYKKDPEKVAGGELLFRAMNCNGCHFNGGGGMGPPLMDNQWIYGDSIENVAATIREGRPNGMPSFRGFIPDEQIWELAAYVLSLSHPLPKSASADQKPK
jgi:cytochrome c oxidase cbb3-type subunit 3